MIYLLMMAETVTTARVGLTLLIWFGSGRNIQNLNSEKTQYVLLDLSSNYGGIYVKMDGSLVYEKSFFNKLRLLFTSKLVLYSLIFSFLKTVSKKIGALEFVSCGFFISVNQPTKLLWNTVIMCSS